ncbi:MAG: helix-turn-helix domain-containing protein [Sciscionella sp.]
MVIVMSTEDDTGGVAGRVAAARKLAGLTQQQLAMRANVSASLVRKVEQGSKPPSPAFVAATATALGLSVSDLYGQPHFVSATSRYGTEQALIPDLERAIMEFRDPSLDGPPMTIGDAGQRLAEVVSAGRKSRYSEALTVLPNLLRGLHVLSVEAMPDAEGERVHTLLTQTYQSAMFTAYKLGHLSLCAWAAERMCWAAGHSGDPLWSAMGEYCRAQSLMFNGSYRTSGTLLDRSAEQASDSSDPRSFEVRGASHLSSAIIAARLSDPDTSAAHLSEARGMARHKAPGDHFDTAFSDANVDIHNVAAAVEMWDGTTALRRGADLQLDGKLYPSRHGHFHIDMARARLLHGDHDGAVNEIQAARHLSPEQTRYHPQVHETIRALARARRRSDPVARLAAWAGVREP